MKDTASASVHASAVLVGNRAVLIRGPSGAGKSRLAFDLILAGRAGYIAPAVLVGDDRIHLEARQEQLQDQLIVRPARELAGLIEIRGLGIRRCDFAAEAIVGRMPTRLPEGRPSGTVVLDAVLANDDWGPAVIDGIAQVAGALRHPRGTLLAAFRGH